MPRDHDSPDPHAKTGDGGSFLEPGGVFDGPLWSELVHGQPALEVGARLGPYEIRGTLGAGGMGEVYRAYDTRLAREVALKVLPRHALDSPDARTRFQREARAVAALSHPNILAIHDVGREGDVDFTVTELLEGETLRARLSSGRPLPPSKAIEYAVHIAHGLSAAHERGIVHRDLKPENVFITTIGRVKILDFGIAQHADSPAAGNDPTIAPLTRTGLIVGTVGYVSPEQILGNPATTRSDLFALGVMIYEMLTGTHPFRRATTPETQTAILREDPAPITHAVPNLAPPFVRIIELCLQKRPEDRPESARDLALFLEASASLTGSTPVTGAPDARVMPPLRRSLVALVCGLMLLATAATWAFVRSSASGVVDTAIEADFARAERVVQRLHRDHLERLALIARLVASFPELKALFATDVATVEDFLLAFRQRMPRTPHLIALGPAGAVVARTDNAASVGDPSGEAWLTALLPGQEEGGVITIDSRPHLAVAVASEAAGTIFGYLIAAEALNQPFAQALSDSTQDDVVLLSEKGALASTLRAAQIPWASLDAWRADRGTSEESLAVRIGMQEYAAREVPLSSDPAVSVILVKSRDEMSSRFAGIERGVLVIGALAAALVFATAAWWARKAERGGLRKRSAPSPS